MLSQRQITLSAQDTAEDTVIVADPSDGIAQSVAEEPENTIVAQNSVVSAEEPTEALGVLNQTTNRPRPLKQIHRLLMAIWTASQIKPGAWSSR